MIPTRSEALESRLWVTDFQNIDNQMLCAFGRAWQLDAVHRQHGQRKNENIKEQQHLNLIPFLLFDQRRKVVKGKQSKYYYNEQIHKILQFIGTTQFL